MIRFWFYGSRNRDSATEQTALTADCCIETAQSIASLDPGGACSIQTRPNPPPVEKHFIQTQRGRRGGGGRTAVDLWSRKSKSRHREMASLSVAMSSE